MIGKPIDFFAKIPANSGLHFVPIPFSKAFADYYTVGELTSKEYPALVTEAQPVDTIAAPAVLAVFNWSKGNDRYRRLEKFVEGLFTKWDKLREPPRHPKWRDVNLAATVPGWSRWAVAEEMLRRIRPKDALDPQVASSDFSAFLKDKGSPAANFSQEHTLPAQRARVAAGEDIALVAASAATPSARTFRAPCGRHRRIQPLLA